MAAAPRAGSLWQTAKAVGSSFFGVRKSSASQDEAPKLNPVHVIAVAFVGVMLFVGGLILLVRWVVAP
jgi:hypothetical protein